MKKWLLMILMGAIMTTATACGSGSGGKEEGKDKQTNKEGKTVVTLSIHESSPFYQLLEKKFEEKYPDIDLQIQSNKNKGEKYDQGDYEKYKKTTNTAVLSGKGPDIIGTGGLPFEDYVNKQLLLNMNDLLDQDQTLNKNDLQMKILESLKLNGGLYSIPSGFGISAFVGDGNAINNSTVKIDDKSWNWNTFKEISKQLIQQAGKGGNKQLFAMANTPPELYIQEMVAENYEQFVDRAAKKAKFDSPEFVELMQQIKKMYDEKVMTAEEAKMDNQLFSSASLMSPKDFIDSLYSSFENPVLLQKPHTGQSEGTRIFTLSEFAILANSPVKDEAWKVISFLLSDEAQSLQEREGFSLLKSVNDKKIDELQEKVKSGTYKLPDGKMAKVSDETFTKYKQFVHSADRYEEWDGTVISIVDEEAATFFHGQKSAEEVAKLIQNRVTTYINE
ncbi:carbohydrate ABC transporter substrate-binding protein [Paenibacillus donghaensis]|uniref:ABC transporter substrate-binding protein n=1 Tax=Paenibacillus donghaensis TaxID=414771 RepID=UPI001883D3F0|nr:ABC transporter substrate-binding protein [Paenibacillus donghaensis]MBE9914890.1 carbohydrate ABC transporter substrate-binding protein [Paenibacillus donghaensis]